MDLGCGRRVSSEEPLSGLGRRFVVIDQQLALERFRVGYFLLSDEHRPLLNHGACLLVVLQLHFIGAGFKARPLADRAGRAGG